VGDKYLSSLIMEGLPSVAMALISGKGDIQKGNFYNVGQKLGAQGFQTVNDVLAGDKSWWNILGGASWSKFSSGFESLNPLFQVMMSPLREDDKYFKIKAEDMTQIFKEIGSVNTAWRSIMAANTARWMSKKGVFLQDNVSPLNAIFMGVTGLQPQESMDLSNLSASKKDEDERQKDCSETLLS
jgi:hypothetical protein